MRIIKVAQSIIKTPSLSAITMFKPYTLSGELWFMDSTTGVTVRYLTACQTNPLRDSPFIIPRYTRVTTGFTLAVHVYSHYVHKKSEDMSRRMNIQRILYISFSIVFWTAFYGFTNNEQFMVFRNTNKGLTILMYQTFFAKNFTDEYLRYK